MEKPNKKPLLLIVGILVILIVVIFVGVVVLQIQAPKNLNNEKFDFNRLNVTIGPSIATDVIEVTTTNTDESIQVSKTELDSQINEIDTLLKDVSDLDSSFLLEESDITQ